MQNITISRIAFASLAAILFIAAASYNFAKLQSTTPEELITNLQDAAHKGDVDAFLSGLTAESRKAVEKSYADRPLLRQTQDEFRKALDERFGQGTAFVRSGDGDLRAAIGRLAPAEVVSKKDRTDGSVELQVKTTIKTDGDKTTSREDTLVALKEDGAWKLVLGFPADRSDAGQIRATVERFAADVRSGKYQDRMAAMLALDKALAPKEGNK